MLPADVENTLRNPFMPGNVEKFRDLLKELFQLDQADLIPLDPPLDSADGPFRLWPKRQFAAVNWP